MGGAVVGKLAGKIIPDVAKDIGEAAMPYLASEEAHLAQSRIGNIFLELRKNRYEPLWKRMQASGREALESTIRTIPERDQLHLHDVVVNNAAPKSPAINQAATRMKKIYYNGNVPFDPKTMKDDTVIGMWTKWNQQQAKRKARQAVFGEQDEALTGIIKHAYNEKGLIYANTVADNMSVYFRDYRYGSSLPYKQAATKGTMAVPLSNVGSDYKPPTDIEVKTKGWMSSFFVSRAAIPHLGQILNPILENGIGNVVKAMGSVFRGDPMDKARIINAGLMEEEMLHELTNRPTSKLGKFIDTYVRMPGFKQVRKFEIITSALSSKYAARELADDIISNPNDKRAIAHLKFLGLDPQKIASRGKILAEEEDLAMYRGVDRAMFFRSGTSTPPAWDKTATARIMTMYKSYGFNQVKFLKDVLKRDYNAGPKQFMRTVAMLSIAFPAVGALIHAAENTVTGHNPTDDLDNYLDNFARVGGLGIWYSAFRAAKRHALSDFMIGPIFGSINDLAQDVTTAATSNKQNWKPVERDVLTKVPIVGPGLSHTLIPGTRKKHN